MQTTRRASWQTPRPTDIATATTFLNAPPPPPAPTPTALFSRGLAGAAACCYGNGGYPPAVLATKQKNKTGGEDSSFVTRHNPVARDAVLDKNSFCLDGTISAEQQWGICHNKTTARLGTVVWHITKFSTESRRPLGDSSHIGSVRDRIVSKTWRQSWRVLIDDDS